jgi:hypothetical protein
MFADIIEAAGGLSKSIARTRQPGAVFGSEERNAMANKGNKDAGNKEQKKKAKLTLKEKRKLKREKGQASSNAILQE